MAVTQQVQYETLEHVAEQARPYPTYLLEGARTGLCLFSAAFLGHNEAIHFALEGVRTTCVDINEERLQELADLYPAEWDYLCADAWEFAAAAAELGEAWDVVSVDTFRGNATERSLADLMVWTKIANKAVAFTLEEGQVFELPDGWTSHAFRRNSEVFWGVLTRD